MYDFGKFLEVGVLVEIYGQNLTGLIISRDSTHLHLWNVFVNGAIHCYHSSKLRKV